MIALSIHHKTTYRFNRLVSLWPHRLMLRPAPKAASFASSTAT